MIEPLEISFEVACPPAHAFATFARRTGLWWPSSHSFSGDPELEVVIEPEVGGRIFERTATGDEHDWGEVTAWDEPSGLSYLWHLGTDRSRATQVTIEFAETELGTTMVQISHSGWDALGEEGAAWRDRNRGGWAGVLDPYSVACVTAEGN